MVAHVVIGISTLVIGLNAGFIAGACWHAIHVVASRRGGRNG